MAWQVRYGVVLLATLIFGPRVLENVLNRPVFDPLRELFGHVINYALAFFHGGWGLA